MFVLVFDFEQKLPNRLVLVGNLNFNRLLVEL